MADDRPLTRLPRSPSPQPTRGQGLDPVEKAMKQAHCTTHASTPAVELVCPAGSLPALKAAVDNGADCVYLGFRDATNARNFAGLNFDEAAIAEGIRYAHAKGRKVFLALNTYAQPQAWQEWRVAVDRAADSGVDAMIVADPGLMAYASRRHPQLRLHLSVQGSATHYEAINFRSEEQKSELQSLMRISYAVFYLKKKNTQ